MKIYLLVLLIVGYFVVRMLLSDASVKHREPSSEKNYEIKVLK